MAIKKVIWTVSANSKFQEILEFYIQRNGSTTYSLKLLNETEDLLKTLSKNEFIGRLTSNKKTRVIPIKVYLTNEQANQEIEEWLNKWKK